MIIAEIGLNHFGQQHIIDNYLDGEMSACYWLNGELHYLVKQGDVPEGIEDWYWSEAKGIHIE